MIISSSSSVPNSTSNDMEVAEFNAESIASMDVAALLTRAIERENAKASNYRSQLVDAEESDSSSGDDEEGDDA